MQPPHGPYFRVLDAFGKDKVYIAAPLRGCHCITSLSPLSLYPRYPLISLCDFRLLLPLPVIISHLLASEHNFYMLAVSAMPIIIPIETIAAASSHIYYFPFLPAFGNSKTDSNNSTNTDIRSRTNAQLPAS